jgi:hypothetical protein
MTAPDPRLDTAPPVLDFRRFRAFAPVLLGVSACLALGHLLLSTALGAEPAWLRDGVAVDWSYYQLFGKQVAGAEWQLRREQRAPVPPRFGVLLGASTIQRGPLPSALEARTGEPWLLLGIGGGTGAFSKIARSLRVLEASRLHPDRIILGVHPLWLCLSPPQESEPSPLDALWFVRHQLPVSNLTYDRLQTAREGLFRRLGFGTWAAFVPAADPWHPAVEKPIERAASLAEVQQLIQTNARLGRFEPDCYRPDGPQALELAALLPRLRALSPRVIIATLPEHSLYRANMPERAERVLLDTLHAAGQPQADILDLRDSMRDEWFTDSYHLTMTGRRVLSDVLAEKLRD